MDTENLELDRFLRAQERDCPQALDAFCGGVPDAETLRLLSPSPRLTA